MDIAGKTQQEIQQLIFEELKKGKSAESLKTILQENGQKPEGYYFTSEEEYQQVASRSYTPGGYINGWTMGISIIIIIIIVVFRIIRYSNRM